MLFLLYLSFNVSRVLKSLKSFIFDKRLDINKSVLIILNTMTRDET